MPKNKIDQKSLNQFYAIADAAARGHFHEIYKRMGERQGRAGQNFHCWTGQHEDANPSLSVDNETGVWKCFGCGASGNLNTYYKNYVAGNPNDQWGGSYTDFFADMLGLTHLLSPKESLKNDMASAKVIQADHFKTFIEKLKLGSGTQRKIPEEKTEKTYTPVPIDVNDKFVEELLATPDAMNFIYSTRMIDKTIIEKYRIGFSSEHDAFTFPMINERGEIVNVKLYRPWKPMMKWQCLVPGNPIIPTPYIHLTLPKLYIFEGEPDLYCGAAHGYYGITCGSASIKDLKKAFGNNFEQAFRNKEIVIVMDADEVGLDTAKKFAKDLLPICKQIKIINLNKSDQCPTGLDPSLTKIVNGKVKRAEKDFTEFMQKNGFGEQAKAVFDRLEQDTEVYSENTRESIQEFKVSIGESLNPKYWCPNSTKRLEIIGSVIEVSGEVFHYPTRIAVRCKPLFDINYKTAKCKRCALMNVAGFGDNTRRTMEFEFVRMSATTPYTGLQPNQIRATEMQLLGMVDVSAKQADEVKKQLLDIPDTCNEVVFTDLQTENIQKVIMTRDPDELIDISLKEIFNKDKRPSPSQQDSREVTVFMMGFIIPMNSGNTVVSKSYRIKAIQTRYPKDQSVVLFAYEIQPLEASFDSFVMTPEIYEMLKIFRPKEGQSIGEHLAERYEIFSHATGLDGRQDLFMIADLAYFSPIVLNNPEVLPAVTRGWVEVLIAGDSRCGKSIVGKFLCNHYRVGDFISGSRATSRSGLLGGMAPGLDGNRIQWGKLPQNDRGIVIIDELSVIDIPTLISLNSLRSDGIAEIVLQQTGKTPARVRKIMFSNWRTRREEDINTALYGIEMLRDLCVEDAVFTRFDVATVVKNADIKKHENKYEKISTRFTSYQCKTLLHWAYSRKPDQIMFEDGFSDALNRGQDIMLEKFHRSTQLVNQEMRAKLCRLSISLATMLFSTKSDDWDVIYVKKEHLDYIVNFLINLYSSKNMGMIEYTNDKRRLEKLGDMRFMMNILKYVDINSVIAFREGYEREVLNLFADYLMKVTKYELNIVDGNSDERLSTGYKINELQMKFMSLLLARNCFVKTKFNRYKKTDAFTEWLLKRKERGNNVETSDILEVRDRQYTVKSKQDD